MRKSIPGFCQHIFNLLGKIGESFNGKCSQLE